MIEEILLCMILTVHTSAFLSKSQVIDNGLSFEDVGPANDQVTHDEKFCLSTK